MASPREHIDHIRKTTFSIGGEKNPLAPMLDQAVKYLSAELYAKDVHFLMELIQNAEDNEYLKGVDPSLEFVITSRDITATGAPATLLIFNSEKGFSDKNIESICSVGNSTKKGNRKRGYIGEKGIGFKSVFLITPQPVIFSNGYQIRFNEKPCPHCNLGYIVPEWVEENPSLSDVKQIYGFDLTLPTTTIVLPLKPDKVKPVKQQLSSIHPEVLLFLSKIKSLSVREENEDPRLNTVSEIAITKETNFRTRESMDAESYTLHLSAQENSTDEQDRECSYSVWKQKFPVKKKNEVEKRKEVEDWVITLAFPNGERLRRGKSLPGVYAFLPTEMVTNFPFMIQADFIMASSRETILLDDKWNQGILDCVPLAFTNAFVSLVKMREDAPVSSLPRLFQFLPIMSSHFPTFNAVRESIKIKLAEEEIVPSESFTEQKFFHKPSETGRIMPAFWSVLNKAKKEGVRFHNLSSHGCYVVSSHFDEPKYGHALDFLGVGHVDNEWYARCIQSSRFVMGVSEDVYLQILLFVANNWRTKFFTTTMGDIPLIKYVDGDGSVSLCSINESAQKSSGRLLCQSHQNPYLSWLIDWNKEFGFVGNRFFLPKSTQEAIYSFSEKEAILQWLRVEVKVSEINLNAYAEIVTNHINDNRKNTIAYACFLYQSFIRGYLNEEEVDSLCGKMPLVDSYGHVTKERSGVLVPANGSKWMELIGSNPWREENYVELGEDYLHPACFAGTSTPEEKFMEFVITRVKASDIPNISPPNAGIATLSGPLTKQNAFLLLDWIRELKRRRIYIPSKLFTCIKQSSWLRILVNGSPGHRPPSQSFLLTSNGGDSNWGTILQNGTVFVDMPLIDQDFYGDKIKEYKEELKTIGVMFKYGEAFRFIADHLMSLAASSNLSRSYVISILNFIRLLQKYPSLDHFVSKMKEGRWLKTSRGSNSPNGSVLYSEEWKTARQISKIPFIDKDDYGEEINSFKPELQLLGVIVDLNVNYQMVADNLLSSFSSSLTEEAVLFILDCLHHSTSSDKLAKALKSMRCMNTDVGYKCPGECFFSDAEWGCLLKVFNSVPLIDHKFYGSRITARKNELKQLGVKVDFEEAVNVFVISFKQQALSSSITKENAFSILSCYRKLKGASLEFPLDLEKCIHEVNWLRTRLGDYRSPRDCILNGPEWESISPVTLLPFIDDGDNFYGKGIREYEKELKKMGVVVEFKDGVEFVAAALYFPLNPCHITSENVFSLLECIRILLQEKDYSFPYNFLKNVRREWLKTHVGYRTPDYSCLFDSKWGLYLKSTDGPFIDEMFYGSNISSYREELSSIGVTVEVEKACPLLASNLCYHSEFSTIVRIFNFLSRHKWMPESDATRKIWIPDGHENGRWVNPEECVLHNRDGLFGQQFTFLEEYYEPNLLCFFSTAFNVTSNPSFDSHCKLWKVWETSGYQLSHAQCCAFWECVVSQWSSEVERTLADGLMKLPVHSGCGEILLLDKNDVFVADDLLLKELFENHSPRPVLVWYPQPSLPSLPRSKLLEIYRKIGVRTISESAQKEELSLAGGVKLKPLNPSVLFIGKEMVRLILGFLADPSLKMEMRKRHEAVQCLLNITALVTSEPITVSYSLSLSSGEIVKVRASRMIRWDRKSSRFYTQKPDKAGGPKGRLEYATCLSEAIAGGVLWDKEVNMNALCELIKFAVLVNFNEEAVQFLMKSKNLQIFEEDEEFLSAAFP
ncbi:hypothetical protein SADUNF_Sadunf15G0089500 [Salix dunnii]|uniref:Sacsin/Nov domain-containing protein n=1 Tax=Salix dunnii TaxID=1413687 RepID=A0A835MLB4_9ROSI|nr:hypothetical protein SADUNF_Sadunf15G0089500 [Salix dunnii]